MAENPKKSSMADRYPLLWIGLGVYVVISVFYQAVVFPNLPGGTEKHTFSTDCFQLGIRFPRVLTVATRPGGEVSQPATLWLWKRPSPPNPTECETKEKASIAISSNVLDLVWFDDEGKEVAPGLLLQTGETQENAPPHRIFVYIAPQTPIAKSADLQVEIDGQDVGTLPVATWPPGISSLFRLLNIALGSPNLAFLAAIVAIVSGMYKILQDNQTRRQQQQKEFETALQTFESLARTTPERIAEEYFALREKTQGWNLPAEQHEQLERKFKAYAQEFASGRIWAHSLRKDILRRLQGEQDKADEHKTWLDKIQAKTGFPTPEEYVTLLSFWENTNNTNKVETLSDVLKNGLNVFRTLGMESADWVVERVYAVIHQLRKIGSENGRASTTEPNTNAINAQIYEPLKIEWFQNGRAAGHYLLEKLAQYEQSQREAQNISNKMKVPGVRAEIQRWEGDTPTPPNQIKPPFGLWGRDPVYETSQRVLDLLGGASPRWRHPFGPLKAEDDPRLPLKAGENDKRPVAGLFWNEHPLWTQVNGEHSCLVTTPPGRGGSAMLLMGRHTRRLWGRAPALSLGLTLSGKPDAALLWQQAERALSETLRRDLVEDPYWLLNAPGFVREWVVSFFQKQYGEVARLSSRLREAGLPDEDADVVISVLHMAIGRNAYQGAGQFTELLTMLRQVLGESARYRLRSGKFDIFYWIELPDPRYAITWLETLREAGLLNLGVQKIFCRAQLPKSEWNEIYQPLELTWREEDLEKMLLYRLRQCNQPELEVSLDTQELARQAQGSPTRLIALGNEAVHKLARQEQGA